MKPTTTRRHAAALIGAALFAGAAVLGPTRAQELPPLTTSDFQQVALRGFGDRSNSWPQSMVWWHDALFVGTARESFCTSLFSIWSYARGLFGQAFADTYLPYPPPDPDLPCAPDGADLPLQAEIWRWTPVGSWMRVFQSPADLDNPGTGPPAPPRTGKKLPYEISIRGMTSHREPDGTDALYAFGVNSTVMWNRNALPPPRILRSTDGITFTPLPQTPGTFLHDLPFNPDHSSFRSPVSFNGKLFVLSGPIFGQGTLIASANPSQGDDAWFQAAPVELQFFEIAAFNGWLYMGTLDPNGYAVFKTRAEGPPPYTMIPVVPTGAGLMPRPSRSVVSMHEYRGRLYVGTATFTEFIRINPDDTWDLLVGSPRLVPLPAGGSEWKYPLSGLDAGWGHTLNDHAWEMEHEAGQLYIGTYDASIGAKRDPVNGPLLQHVMGADLYRTPDGWYYSALTTNGFSTPADPFGGRFDYGIRNIVSTPYGLFLGTANDFYGLGIFRATPHPSTRPGPPWRLEVEQGLNGRALLSWSATPKGTKAQIWRAEILPIGIRDDTNIEAWIGFGSNKVPDFYVGPYLKIGVTASASFIDATVQPGKRYMYFALFEKAGGLLSDQSNLVTYPLRTPAVTFVQMLSDVERLYQRHRIKSPVEPSIATVRQRFRDARAAAGRCDMNLAIKTLLWVPAYLFVLDPDSTDVEILVSKMVRRLTLYKQFPLDVSSTEFCM